MYPLLDLVPTLVLIIMAKRATNNNNNNDQEGDGDQIGRMHASICAYHGLVLPFLLTFPPHMLCGPV